MVLHPELDTATVRVGVAMAENPTSRANLDLIFVAATKSSSLLGYYTNSHIESSAPYETLQGIVQAQPTLYIQRIGEGNKVP